MEFDTMFLIRSLNLNIRIIVRKLEGDDNQIANCVD